MKELNASGTPVAQVHLRHLNPLPPDLGDIVRRYRRVLVPEMNLGQLVKLVRAEYLVPAESLTKIQGRPFKVAEIVTQLRGEAGPRQVEGARKGLTHTLGGNTATVLVSLFGRD